MLSRIMRHPAGLMRKALAGRFLANAWGLPGASAVPPALPAYWTHRYSRIGILLAAPEVPAPPAITAAALQALDPAAAALTAQGGKASSFLSAAKVPAARA